MGDYTRFTHQPRKRYAAVLMQQGRVQLDADWNEQSDISKHRVECQAIDTLGSCMVPDSTPDAFKVGTPAGTPRDFSLSPGRIYVDGLLAELFDGETFKSNPISYRNQPYFPDPPDPPGVPANAVVYLDVWDREVTAIEDPDLLEKALGGPDTTTRRQTVWQVRLKDTTSNPAACDTDLGLATPDGKLSTRIGPSTGDDGPCGPPAQEGYTGRENQLYRVEIQTPGAVGTAKFKWSRDNASLAVAVSQITVSGGQSTLTVSRTGYDKVRRFQLGDWVEVLDDNRELRGEGGVVAQIAAAPDETANQITLNTDLTGLFVASDSQRHTRLRCWDQQSGLGTDGLVTTSATWTDLEKGIQLQFAGTTFRVGDYWVFWARYVDGTIELLDAAPPRGITHHYCRLAALNGGAVQDCRPHPTHEEGCCTRVVHPGEDIQAALDALPGGGGCVCLKTGVHPISQALRIRNSNVVLHGETTGAVVRHSGGPLMLRIGSDDGSTIDHVHVEDIRFEATVDGQPTALLEIAMVDIRRLADGSIAHCAMAPAAAVRLFNALGVMVSDCGRVSVEGNAIENLLAGVLVLRSGGVDVRRNLLLGPTQDSDSGSGSFSIGLVGIEYDDDAVGPASIAENRIDNYRAGILLGTASAGAIVSDNWITRNGPMLIGGTTGAAVALVNRSVEAAAMMVTAVAVAPAAAVSVGSTTRLLRIFAIDVGGPRSAVIGNVVNLTDPRQGGIRLRGDQQRAAHNVVRSDLVFQPGAALPTVLPLGIVVSDLLTDHPLADCRMEANILTGLQNAVTLGDGPGPNTPSVISVARARVQGNRIDGSAALVSQLVDPFVNPEAAVTFTPDALGPILGNYAIGVGASQDTVIADNQVTAFATAVELSSSDGTQVAGNQVGDGIVGVFADLERGLSVSGNTFKTVPFAAVHGTQLTDATIAQNTITGATWFGIGLSSGAHSRVADNRISDGGVGIWVSLESGATLTGNVISRMQSTGLACVSCVDGVTCAHNQAAWCSFGGLPFRLLGLAGAGENTIAIGLVVYGSDGLVTIESNDVMGTGRSAPDDPATVFSQSTYQIAALASGTCRLHSNTTIEADGLVGDENHAALVVGAFGRKVDEWQSAELTDNNVNGMGSPLVLASSSGDISFSNNRCAHTPTPIVGRPPVSTVQLTGQRRVALVGNMIRAVDGAVPSLTITSQFVTAVGNATTGLWTVSGNVSPTAFDQFNQIGHS